MTEATTAYPIPSPSLHPRMVPLPISGGSP